MSAEFSNRSLRRISFGIRHLAFGILAAAVAAAADLSSARALLDAKKLPEAQQAFEQLAAADPKNAEVNYHLGDLALRRNELDNGVAYLEKSVAADPQNSRYHHRLGDAYGTQAAEASVFRQLGFAKKCLAAYERAVALDPNNVEARASLFEFYRRAPGLLGGGIDKATAQAAAVKQLNPARGRFLFATLYVGEKKYAEAFAEYDEVLKSNPDDFAALFQIGRLAATTGQFVDRGLTSLRRCLELPAPTTPNTPGHAAAHWRLGNLLEKKKDLAGARAAYEAALKLDPNFAPAAESLKKLK